MDGPDVVMPAWSLVRGYLSPATLFLLLNVVIGTIALSSRSQRRRPQNHGDGDHPQHQPQHHQEQQGYNNDRYAPAQPPAPLARTSSVMERLRSLGLYRFRSGDFPPEYAAPAPDHAGAVTVTAGDAAHYSRSRSEPAHAPAPSPREKTRKRASAAGVPPRMRKSSSSSSQARKNAAASARAAEWAAVRAEEEEEEQAVVDARAEEFSDSFMPSSPPAQQQQQKQQQQEEEEVYYREEYVPPLRPTRAAAAPLARAPSVLERLRSFSLYRFTSGDLAAEAAPAAEEAHYGRSQSERQSKKGKSQQGADAEERRMTKSSSEARKPAPAPEEPAEQGVDARADDFINSFRQQLKLQRLNSLLNYKEMLNRGSK